MEMPKPAKRGRKRKIVTQDARPTQRRRRVHREEVFFDEEEQG